MEVVVTKLPHETLVGMEYAEVFDLNILNKDDIVELLFAVRPDYILHLAAQSSVSAIFSCVFRSVCAKRASNSWVRESGMHSAVAPFTCCARSVCGSSVFSDDSGAFLGPWI